jgi:DNA-binding response OmpR family regulator
MPKKILVVEDDESIGEIVELLLMEAGFQVQLTGSVREFSKCFYTYHADLVILDIRLPDGDGRDLCRAVKQDYTAKDIPVILMSAHAIEDELMYKSGANAFVSKPFDIDFFLEQVNKQLGTYS